MPNLLVFATGGVAFGSVEQRLTLTTAGNVGFLPGEGTSFLECVAASPCLAGSSSQISVGWTVGAGLEYSLTRQVALKGEYLFVDLGDYTVTGRGTHPLSTPDVFLKARSTVDLHIVRAGFNVKF